jgi:hypothetical protein
MLAILSINLNKNLTLMKTPLKVLFFSMFIISCNQNSQNEFDISKIDSIANELEKQDAYEIKELKRFTKIDSLSEYETSNMKKFVDSIKINDSVKYFALKKIIEKDTSNYYEDFSWMAFGVDKLKSKKEYQKLAKKELMGK